MKPKICKQSMFCRRAFSAKVSGENCKPPMVHNHSYVYTAEGIILMVAMVLAGFKWLHHLTR
jgi:hypothetical protein